MLVSGGRLVTDNVPTGGIFMLNQAKLISKNYTKVGLLSSGFIEFSGLLKKDSYNEKEKINSLNVWKVYKKHFFPRRYLSYNYQKKIYSKLAIDQFEKYIRENGLPDLIHAHNILFSGIVAQLIFEMYKIPYLITEHSSAFYMNVYSKSFLSKILKDFDDCGQLTTVSQSNAEFLNKIFNRDCKVLPNVITNIFKFENKIKNESFRFLCVAKLIKMKNVDEIIKAFKITSSNFNTKLTIVGSGPLENYIKELIENLKLSDRIELIEYLSPNKLSRLIKDSDCLVLNSTYETFGVIVAEALACGTPAIISKCGGPEHMINSTNGLVVDLHSISQISSSMDFMINNHFIFDSEKISKNAIKQFSEKSFMKKLYNLYKKIE